MLTLTLKLKLPIILSCLLMNFMSLQDSFKDMVDKYVADVSLTDKKSNILNIQQQKGELILR